MSKFISSTMPKKAEQANRRIQSLVRDLVRQDQIFSEMTHDAILLAQEGVQRLMPKAKQYLAECQALAAPRTGRAAFEASQARVIAAYGVLDKFLRHGQLPGLSLDKNLGYGLLSAYIEEKTGYADRFPGYGVRNQARALDYLRQRGRAAAVKSIADYLHRRSLEYYRDLEQASSELLGTNKKLSRLLKPFVQKRSSMNQV
jgi:hypothetical protein